MLPGEPCAGLATGFGNLWVPLCTAMPSLAKVDLTANRLTTIFPVGPTGKIVVKRLAVRSTFASEGIAVHSGTHRLPKPVASPAHGSPGNITLASNRRLCGNLFWFVYYLRRQLRRFA